MTDIKYIISIVIQLHIGKSFHQLNTELAGMKTTLLRSRINIRASKKPLPTTAISDAPATIPCFASTSSEIAKVQCFGPAMFTARTVGRRCWNQS